jgi:hypothetical protein
MIDGKFVPSSAANVRARAAKLKKRSSVIKKCDIDGCDSIMGEVIFSGNICVLCKNSPARKAGFAELIRDIEHQEKLLGEFGGWG